MHRLEAPFIEHRVTKDISSKHIQNIDSYLYKTRSSDRVLWLLSLCILSQYILLKWIYKWVAMTNTVHGHRSYRRLKREELTRPTQLTVCSYRIMFSDFCTKLSNVVLCRGLYADKVGS